MAIKNMVLNNINDWRESVHEKLPKTEEEAKARYKKYKDKDPYPKIEPALLNTVDIYKYVCTTGMIFPFCPVSQNPKEDKKCLAGASYEVGIKGDVIYWDNKGEKFKIPLEKDKDVFELLPNSIAFVTLEPYFQIPDYIALRFNLKIKHIYKGLLLGTGPLVDPGFVGRLSIPLHNLTANPYWFKKGDKLIQLEFTKLSNYKGWKYNAPEKDIVEGPYIENEILSDRTVEEYIDNAIKDNRSINSVRSSIPDAIEEGRKNIEEAKISADKAEKTVHKLTFGGAIGVGITLLATIISLYLLFHDVFVNINGRIIKLYDQNEEYKSKITILESDNKDLQETVEELNSRLKKLENVHADDNEP